MPRSYPAILEGDRIRWTGAVPVQSGPVSVDVTIRDEARPPLGSGNGDGATGRLMADALNALVSSGAFADVHDPTAWQRDTRRDRPLEGRSHEDPPADAP